jgi:hypothetical protein
VVLGIQPRAMCALSKHSTSQLNSQPRECEFWGHSIRHHESAVVTVQACSGQRPHDVTESLDLSPLNQGLLWRPASVFSHRALITGLWGKVNIFFLFNHQRNPDVFVEERQKS